MKAAIYERSTCTRCDAVKAQKISTGGHVWCSAANNPQGKRLNLLPSRIRARASLRRSSRAYATYRLDAAAGRLMLEATAVVHWGTPGHGSEIA
jgi:hypothetical protein